MKVQVISNQKSIYEILAPINTLSQLLGIRCFTRNKYGTYNYSWLSLVMSLTTLVAFYTIFNYHNDHRDSTLEGHAGYQSAIVVVLNWLYFYGNIVLMTLGCILAQLNYNKEIKIMKQLEEIDADLRKKNLKDSIDQKNRFLRNLQIGFISYVYLIHYGLLSFSYFFLSGMEHGCLHMVQFIYPSLVNCTIKMQFHFYIQALKTRAEMVNAELNKRIVDVTPGQKCTAFHEIEKDIEATMRVHKKITDASRCVNRIYDVQELLSFALCFILLLSDGYVVLYSLTVGGDTNLDAIFHALKRLVLNLVELLLDLRACMLVCAKVNHTKNVLFKIKIDPQNEEVRNLIMVAVFKLMHDKLEFTAYDLFNMDFEFIFSMFASITTYLLIFLQFDIDAAKTRYAVMKANLTQFQGEF